MVSDSYEAPIKTAFVLYQHQKERQSTLCSCICRCVCGSPSTFLCDLDFLIYVRTVSQPASNEDSNVQWSAFVVATSPPLYQTCSCGAVYPNTFCWMLVARFSPSTLRLLHVASAYLSLDTYWGVYMSTWDYQHWCRKSLSTWGKGPQPEHYLHWTSFWRHHCSTGVNIDVFSLWRWHQGVGLLGGHY